jgi:hypothetical protein
MRKWSLIGICLLIFSCGEKKTDLSGNTPIKINDFNKVFKNTELPVSISDTSLNHELDTLVIQRKALAQFVPDSIIDKFIAPANKNKAIIHPLIRIEQETEYYLLLNIKYPKKHDIVAIVFNKKNKYLDFQSITEFLNENKSSTKYEKKLNINREPSFLVEENVISPEGVSTYEKNAWAYSDGNFRLIYFDSNKTPENKTIINPIDTISSKNIYSGNYGTDAKNFIALRDNGAPNKYQFFIHFEKRNGSCVGELKGVLNFNNNTATYSEKGDACIVHFSITGNNIAIKEDGNCGNHRGMKCYFNDKFDKVRKSKKKK